MSFSQENAFRTRISGTSFRSCTIFHANEAKEREREKKTNDDDDDDDNNNIFSLGDFKAYQKLFHFVYG